MIGYRDKAWTLPGSHIEDLDGVELFFPSGDRILWEPTEEQIAVMRGNSLRMERFEEISKPDPEKKTVVTVADGMEIEEKPSRPRKKRQVLPAKPSDEDLSDSDE